MKNMYSKAQTNFFTKLIFIVAAAVAFFLVFMYFNSFRKETIEEKESSDFKMGAMNVLQKLITDESCLAYEYNQTQRKIIIDKNKLDVFSSEFDEVEPNCSKALGFDYNIQIGQFPHNFSLYPEEIIINTEPEYSTDFAQHQCKVNQNEVLYIKMNFLPTEEICTRYSELDIVTGTRTLGLCPDECYPDPLVNCPYPDHKMCGIPYHCPAEKCECIENQLGAHPWIVTCDEVDLETDCTPVSAAHTWCGKVVKEIEVPSGPVIDVDIMSTVWNFGLSTGTGVNSFSPEKARIEEVQLSIPVTIRYNESFSTEGMIFMYAVRGELESFYSLLEDICEKTENEIDVSFSKNFHFSYPVSYSEPDLCMLDSCKKFVCSYDLDFENIESEGDYVLKFSLDHSNKVIRVEK